MRGCIATLLFCIGLSFSTQAAPVFPEHTGRVMDDAHVLSPAAIDHLTNQLSQLEAGTTDQFVIVTLPSLQGITIEEFGYQLGRHWGIGQRDKNNGILLIVAPNDRKVRIEVGYGLEGTMTDALSAAIIDSEILPAFKQGNTEQGVLDGTTAIISVLQGDSAAIAELQSPQPEKHIEGWYVYLIPFMGIFFMLILIFFQRTVFRIFTMVILPALMIFLMTQFVTAFVIIGIILLGIFRNVTRSALYMICMPFARLAAKTGNPGFEQSLLEKRKKHYPGPKFVHYYGTRYKTYGKNAFLAWLFMPFFPASAGGGSGSSYSGDSGSSSSDSSSSSSSSSDSSSGGGGSFGGGGSSGSW